MSGAEVAAFSGGCAMCCLVIAWWVCGGLAASYAYDDAVGCGWWMWGTFIAELVYLPFAVLLGGAYTLGAFMSITSEERVSTDHACVDGFMRAVMFFILNLLNGLLLGFGGYAMWNEDCIPHDTWLHPMSRAAFWICAVITAFNILAAMAEIIKYACC